MKITTQTITAITIRSGMLTGTTAGVIAGTLAVTATVITAGITVGTVTGIMPMIMAMITVGMDAAAFKTVPHPVVLAVTTRTSTALSHRNSVMGPAIPPLPHHPMEVVEAPEPGGY